MSCFCHLAHVSQCVLLLLFRFLRSLRWCPIRLCRTPLTPNPHLHPFSQTNKQNSQKQTDAAGEGVLVPPPHRRSSCVWYVGMLSTSFCLLSPFATSLFRGPFPSQSASHHAFSFSESFADMAHYEHLYSYYSGTELLSGLTLNTRRFRAQRTFYAAFFNCVLLLYVSLCVCVCSCSTPSFIFFHCLHFFFLLSV